MTQALRLSTAFALSLALCGAALAAPAAPGASNANEPAYNAGTPATPDTNAGMPKEQMHQGAGTPTPGSPNTNLNTTGKPTTTGQSGQGTGVSRMR
jgi:hypothetical protein